MIRVVDNGGGIPADELPLAVASHATSKLAEADDLFRVGTLGFRGEALASIAEVSRLASAAGRPTAKGAARLEVVGGTAGAVAPAAARSGTTIEVHNLFFNTPVRRKFLRATATEFGHVSEAFTRIALAAPRTSISPCGTTIGPCSSLAACDELAGSDRAVLRPRFGREPDPRRKRRFEAEVRLSGYVANPWQSRSHNRLQYFFLNGRHIRDRSLQHALGEAYRGLMMVGRQPIAFLPIDDAAGNGRRERPSHEARSAIPGFRPALQPVARHTARQVPRHRPERPRPTAAINSRPGRGSGDADDPTGGHDAAQTAQLRQELVDWAKGKVDSWGTRDGGRRAGGRGPGVRDRDRG